MTKTATKTKLRKLASVRPPVEIRDNTKVRRQWLADRLAEIQAEPNRVAKIVGGGSYQEIRVWEVSQVEGRLRQRGACQFCGHSQVVQGNRLVLHGYTRPGDGYVWGRCPGVDLAPLNTSKVHTEMWLAQAKETLTTAKINAAEAEHNNKLASAAFYTDENAEMRKAANQEYPSKPSKATVWRARRMYEQDITEEQRKAYEAAREQWAAKFPVAATYYDSKVAYQRAEKELWGAKETVRHFQFLIDAKIFGKKLTEEVVA